MESYECLFRLPAGEVRVLNFTRQCLDTTVREPLHSHEFIKIMRICEGSAIWQLGAACHEVLAGDIILLNSTEQRRFVKVTGTGEIRFEWLQFTPLTVYPDITTSGVFYRRPRNFDNIIRRGAGSAAGKERCIDRMEAYFLLLSENAAAADPYREQAMISNLRSLLIEVTRFYHESGESETPANRYCTLENYRIMTEAVLYIRSHFREPLSEEALARHVSLSPSYFSRLFVYFYGIGFKAYLRRMRLEAALETLSAGKGINVIEAALGAGFTSSSGFYRALGEIAGSGGVKSVLFPSSGRL